MLVHLELAKHRRSSSPEREEEEECSGSIARFASI